MLSTFLIYISLSIFFNLNPYFLANSELITNSIALLSNNAFTIISSYILIFFSPIFTITSLSIFLFSRLYIDIFSTTLESIANLLLLRLSQELLNLLPYLNSLAYILVFFHPQFYSLFLCFYNFLLSVQILHSYNSPNSLSYLYL